MADVPSNIGRYEIVKAIGHGGMGSLYLAWDAKLERQIAIKVLKEDDPDLRERFAREAKSAARLRHPHIVTIFELGEYEGSRTSPWNTSMVGRWPRSSATARTCRSAGRWS